MTHYYEQEALVQKKTGSKSDFGIDHLQSWKLLSGGQETIVMIHSYTCRNKSLVLTEQRALSTVTAIKTSSPNNQRHHDNDKTLNIYNSNNFLHFQFYFKRLVFYCILPQQIAWKWDRISVLLHGHEPHFKYDSLCCKHSPVNNLMISLTCLLPPQWEP